MKIFFGVLLLLLSVIIGYLSASKLTKRVDFFITLVYNTTTALGGELAVPCNSQSATARLKGYGRFLVWKAGPYKEC